jgi:NAD(P)-dependent dehydrogenase (short-subunit alcohol dehydrogenase family)
MMLRDRVAVITGAGGGIGRELALAMARAGAKVVVNDLGVGMDGKPSDDRPATDVVEKIQREGGEAVESLDDVSRFTGAQAVIDTAITRYGRIDILVNTAGVLRDRMFHNMSELEWDAVIAVHLKGTFGTCRAATPRFREQRYGRIINFTSTAGLVGAIGQTNYGAAKMGIVGLSHNIALENKGKNITVNCVSPFAWTRMIASIPTDTPEAKERVEKLSKMDPAHVAPLCVFLASEQAGDINGQVFGVRGKEILLFSQPRPVRSVSSIDGWTPESIANSYDILRQSEVPLQTSAEVFGYDPLV